MMTGEIENRVSQHYRHGTLEQAIADALAASGVNAARLTSAELSPVDEFHIGGRQATVEFAEQLDAKPSMHLLDIGSGLGGASRYFAGERGCRVTGIDLTEEYVRVAEGLAKRVGLDGSVSYRQGSALALPFPADGFDGSYMLHVGMNIEDKAALFREVWRVLKPGGVFGIYDVMREGEGDFSFPVPWATTADTSFVVSAADYRRLLEEAGFTVSKERNRREFAIEFFREMRARAARSGGPPPLGLHILMGAATPEKVANMIGNLERGLLGPTEIICRK
jgi:ubiquinone/menaquinone biosynthesis C-methylase UbiE